MTKKLNEHKKLLEICQKIGYKLDLNKRTSDFIPDDDWINEALYITLKKDVREIIFSTNFMDKFRDYYEQKPIQEKDVYWEIRLLKRLEYPVWYLFELLFEND